MRQPIRLILCACLGLAALAGCTPQPPTAIPLSEATPKVIDHLKIFKTGDAPGPTVLFVHGASDRSWNAEYERWVQRLNREGFHVVFLDLYTGRGSNGQAARSGHLLPKQTAGDLMIALDWTRQQAWADPERLYAMGNSFGGATIMDAMVYDAPDRMPQGLSEPPSNGLTGLSKAVLVTPLCIDDIMGLNIVASVHEDFAASVPTLAILAGSDQTSDTPLCQAIFARNAAAGKPIEVVVVDGAGHTFMQSEDDYGQPFPDYDHEEAEAAWARALSFLRD